MKAYFSKECQVTQSEIELFESIDKDKDRKTDKGRQFYCLLTGRPSVPSC